MVSLITQCSKVKSFPLSENDRPKGQLRASRSSHDYIAVSDIYQLADNCGEVCEVLARFKITFRKSTQLCRLVYVVQTFCRQRLLIKLLHKLRNKRDLSCFSGRRTFFFEMQVIKLSYFYQNEKFYK